MNNTTTALIDGDPIVYAVGFATGEDPLENALHSVKVKLNYIMEQTETTKCRVFLSPEKNFRTEICSDYKANRDTSKRPYHYEEIRNYLFDTWKAEVIDGLEADDALGINQTDSTIICTIDKDLDQIPGLHYNYNKDRLYNVTYDEGMKFFHTQMLTGDRADNIQGIRGVGPVKAKHLLEGLTEAEMWCAVGLEYALHFDDPEEVYERNAKLLWILR